MTMTRMRRAAASGRKSVPYLLPGLLANLLGTSVISLAIPRFEMLGGSTSVPFHSASLYVGDLSTDASEVRTT